MRNMSFALTTPQVLDRSKTVTRRLGWTFLQPGDRLRAVKKGMGLKKGEHPEHLGVLEVVDVTREGLMEGLSQSDVMREGFPSMSPHQFADMFIQHHPGCNWKTKVTRILFKYLTGKDECYCDYVDGCAPCSVCAEKVGAR
jgi:hypothetical protein